jgi:hypothetical protein
VTPTYLPPHRAVEVVQKILESLVDHPMRSAESFRNCALGGGLMAINPLLKIGKGEDVDFIRNLINDVVASGRMIDFGFIPNEIMKTESVRSRTMYESGELPHPYDTWLGVSQWEGGYCGYLVSPHPAQQDSTLVIELYGVSLPDMGDAVLVYDVVSIRVEGLGRTMVQPASMDIPPHMQAAMSGSIEKHERSRGSNSLDPLVTMLKFLSDANIPITHTDAPVALNKHRAKKGRFAIPPHTVVHTKDYVSSWRQHAKTGHHALGGHHASPVAHWRRAHLRHLPSGKVVAVKSSKINWRSAEELHRKFYRYDPT